METRKSAADDDPQGQVDSVILSTGMGQQSLKKPYSTYADRQLVDWDGCAVSVPDAFECAISKIERNLPKLATNPGSWGFDENGNYANREEGFHEIGNWTTSFFTGMALLAHLKTGDRGFVSGVENLDELYQRKLENHAEETMHDLGFLYVLYSVGLYRLTGEARHRDTGLRAAEVLASRFVPEGRYIRAWGQVDELDTDYAGLAIIDSLMNLSLLYWAAKETGESRFKELAVKHTDTTLEHFVRQDASVFHAFRFDPVSGDPVGGDNYCGRAVESHWARGTSWAMYGFSLGYQHTGDERYLNTALTLTERYVSLLGDEGVPAWDFKLVNGEPRIKDSSSAAVAVCAVQSLMSQVEVSPEISASKNKMLKALCSDDYFDRSLECGGLLKQGQVGAGLGKAANAYTSWGDYFFMQALATEIGLDVDWW